MKLVLLSCFLLHIVFANNSYSQELSAREIIKKADKKGRGLTSQGTMTLTIVCPDWSRSVTMKSWSKGTESDPIYITAPAKEKGQVFLKR